MYEKQAIITTTMTKAAMYEQVIPFPQLSKTQPQTQASLISIPPVPRKHDCRRTRKQLEQVNIVSPSNIYFIMVKVTNKDMDDQPPQYTTFRQKEIVGSLKTKSPIIQQNITQAYIQSKPSINQDFNVWPPCKQISLLGLLSKVPKGNITWFVIYQPYYKDKLVGKLLFAPQIVSISYIIGEISQQRFFWSQ